MELHSNIIYVYRFDILLIYPRVLVCSFFFFFFSSRRRHTRLQGDWSSDVCSSDLDGENDRIHILLRDTLEVLTTFGEGGRQPGEFYGPHSIATDSKGNIYVTETYRGQRVQKFVYKGLGPVTKEDQGVLWPTTTKK